MPFVVISPQKFAMNQFYDEEEAEPISRLIHHYIATLSLDATRMYLTGLSQGGIGTWNLASNPKYCNIFAAIAAVCGGLRPPFERNAKQLAGMPIWAFHGANDSILPVSMSDESVAVCAPMLRVQSAQAKVCFVAKLALTSHTPLACDEQRTCISTLSLPPTDVCVCARARACVVLTVKYDRIPTAPGEDYSWRATGIPSMRGHASWVQAYYPPNKQVVMSSCGVS